MQNFELYGLQVSIEDLSKHEEYLHIRRRIEELGKAIEECMKEHPKTIFYHYYPLSKGLSITFLAYKNEIRIGLIEEKTKHIFSHCSFEQIQGFTEKIKNSFIDRIKNSATKTLTWKSLEEAWLDKIYKENPLLQQIINGDYKPDEDTISKDRSPDIEEDYDY